VIAGVFVGGASRRMGGAPKGLLLAPREPGSGDRLRVTVAERTIALAREWCAEVVLVGSAGAYAGLGVPAIDDAEVTRDGAPAHPGGRSPSREGPLAGLVALLDRAGDGPVIALACDMPHLQSGMLARLATFAPEAAAVAPRDAGNWSPLFARYDARRVRGVARARFDAGERSLRAVLDAVGARELPLSSGERAALRDWDEPGDIDDGGAASPGED
jgi:molybdopterin-guanine dinucleotide biosynthesis protein A